MAAPTSIAARRKSNRNRNYASTIVHYLGVEEALAVCREKSWNEVHDEILQRHPVAATGTHSP